MRRTLKGTCLSIFLLVLLAGITQPLWAHAVLMESTPKANSTVKGPDVPIVLRFNSRIDGDRSRLHLFAADGSEVKLDAVKQTKPDILESHVTGLKPGAYKLHWQVLASDGHLNRGDLNFTVN